MRLSAVLAMSMLLGLSATSSVKGRRNRELTKVEPCTIKGKVFRSDSNEAISNAYILLMREKDPPVQIEHFDVRTDEKGDYLFRDVPAGKYTVSIYGWFRNKSDVPCQNPVEARTVDDGKATVEWQQKSGAFMEIVTIKGFSVLAGQEKVKDLDLVCTRTRGPKSRY
jgi:hypothetical protein